MKTYTEEEIGINNFFFLWAHQHVQLTARKETIHMLRYERCTCYYYFREKKCTMGTNKNAIKLSNKFVAQSQF